MLSLADAAEAAAKKSWRFRRRIKRIVLGWFIISVILAELAASWFGIIIAHHAPMSMAEAKVVAEQTAVAVVLISFFVLVISAVMQFRARQRLRRLEHTRLHRTASAATG